MNKIFPIWTSVCRPVRRCKTLLRKILEEGRKDILLLQKAAISCNTFAIHYRDRHTSVFKNAFIWALFLKRPCSPSPPAVRKAFLEKFSLHEFFGKCFKIVVSRQRVERDCFCGTTNTSWSINFPICIS